MIKMNEEINTNSILKDFYGKTENIPEKKEVEEDFSFVYQRKIRCAICDKLLLSTDTYINLKGEEKPNIPVKVLNLPSPYIHKRCKQKYNANLLDTSFVIEPDMTKRIEEL